jgi:S-adenosylmethionine:tRNA ribosyltransferase-isomerase
MKLSDFDYELPPALIAQAPLAQRGASRLLHLDGRSGAFQDLLFHGLPSLIAPGDVMVFNDTRVIKARLNGRKRSGGRVEVLIERVLDASHALAQVRASHAPRPGALLELNDGVVATVLDKHGSFHHLHFERCDDLLALLDRVGSVPLPPYIGHPAQSEDEVRYQTVYARDPGAVAAPTAGLHFDAAMLSALRERGVTLAWLTLHVGAGTFQPVRNENLAEHEMHGEWYRLPGETARAINRVRAAGGRVVAVGTTTLRALEAAAAGGELEPNSGETKLFILPGYRFRVVDRLVTNFHLPRSTLLMLVSAFAGMDNIRRAYQHAIERRYRFYSYGDAMLIERQSPGHNEPN